MIFKGTLKFFQVILFRLLLNTVNIKSSINGIHLIISINPFLANAPILHPLKTPENLWFSAVFRGYKMRTLSRKWVKVKQNVTLPHHIYNKIILNGGWNKSLYCSLVKCSKFFKTIPGLVIKWNLILLLLKWTVVPKFSNELMDKYSELKKYWTTL